MRRTLANCFPTPSTKKFFRFFSLEKNKEKTFRKKRKIFFVDGVGKRFASVRLIKISFRFDVYREHPDLTSAKNLNFRTPPTHTVRFFSLILCRTSKPRQIWLTPHPPIKVLTSGLDVPIQDTRTHRRLPRESITL